MSQFSRIDPAQYAHAWENIPYAEQDPLQTVSIYTPGDDGNYPLLIYVNGGGWVQQGPQLNTVPGVWCAPSQGYALASIGHRLAPEWHWPAQALDVKAAIRFLRAHADEYGYNADTVVAWGNSAGGHILSMCAATNNMPLFEDRTMGNPNEDSSIQGLVLFYAPCDLYQMELNNYITPEEFHSLAESPEGIGEDEPGMRLNSNILLGCRALDHPTIAATASPINFVTEEYPPVALFQGMDDPLVPYTHTTSLYNMVNYKCGKNHARMELFDDAVHGDPAIKENSVTARVFDFIDEIVHGARQERRPFPAIETLE